MADTLDNLKREAKRWLRAVRAGDDGACARLRRAHRQAPTDPTLRDVQHALALEHGYSGWSALKQALVAASAGPARIELLRPREFDSDRPHGPWFSPARDVWDTIQAARAGDVDRLRRLIERDPNLARYGEPLHFAVREGHVDAVQVLLAAGADADGVGPGGERLATVARDRGHERVAQVLDAKRGGGPRTVPAIELTTPDHPIHVAAAANDLETLRRLLDEDPDLVRRGDRKGGTPLHRAVLCSAHRAIDLLLDRGADIHARHGNGPGDDEGYAAADFEPIDLALFWHGRGDVETARRLIARGAAYDMSIAAAFGDISGVTRFLDQDSARIREARPWGKRPLSVAVEFGHDAIVHLLLDRGANPNWPEGPEAPQGFSLHSAARTGNRAIVELLLDRGADPNASVDSSGNAVWAAKTSELRTLLMSRGGTLDCYDLVWLDEDDEVVRRVTADPREADAGCGGVFTAAATRHKRDLVVRLLNAGARVPPVLTACRSYLLEDPGILRLLLASGMNPDLPDWQQATLLHAACGRDFRGRSLEHRLECANILLDAGATISAKDEEYRSTPLAWAARNDLADMVELLLARGAPTNLADDEPWATPLAWATKRGHTRTVEMLRKAGAIA